MIGNKKGDKSSSTDPMLLFPKRTYQPSNIRRKRTHGFFARCLFLFLTHTQHIHTDIHTYMHSTHARPYTCHMTATPHYCLHHECNVYFLFFGATLELWITDRMNIQLQSSDTIRKLDEK